MTEYGSFRCRRCKSVCLPDYKFCPECGAPVRKKSAAAEFFMALLKCAGFFGIYFAITFILEFIYELTVIGKNGFADFFSDFELTEDFFTELSKHFCEVGILSAILVLIAFGLVFLARKKKMSDEIRLKWVSPKYFLLLIIMGVAAQIAVSVLLTAVYSLFPSAAESSESYVYELLFKESNPVTEFIYISLLTPLLEETLFRGIIYTRLRNVMPRWGAVILSAAIFGASHGNAEQFIYAGVLGILLAASFEKFDSLWASFAIHFAFNAGSYIMMLMPQDTAAGTVIFAVSSAVLILLIFFVFIKTNRSTEVKNEAL